MQTHYKNKSKPDPAVSKSWGRPSKKLERKSVAYQKALHIYSWNVCMVKYEHRGIFDNEKCVSIIAIDNFNQT